METKKITQKLIDTIEPPVSGRLEIRDLNQRSIILRVTPNGVKTISLAIYTDGKSKRIAIGRYPDKSLKTLRDEAEAMLDRIKSGIDLDRNNCYATVEQALNEMIASRQLKPKTVGEYRRLLKSCAPEWRQDRISQIGREDVSNKYKSLCETSVAQANAFLRMFRATWNFAEAKYQTKDFDKNPCKVINDTKSMRKLRPRQRIIMPLQMPVWFKSIRDILLAREGINEYAPLVGCALMIELYTGLRCDDVQTLAIKPNVDGASGYFDEHHGFIHIEDSKNNQELTIPLNRHALFWINKARKMNPCAKEFLFERRDNSTFMDESRFRYWLDVLCKQSGIKITQHDNRRTFITIGESLDISRDTIKKLAGHKQFSDKDVTSNYIVSLSDRLQSASQRIADKISELAGEIDFDDFSEVPEFSGLTSDQGQEP